jgi:hypothetical protein
MFLWACSAVALRDTQAQTLTSLALRCFEKLARPNLFLVRQYLFLKKAVEKGPALSLFNHQRDNT